MARTTIPDAGRATINPATPASAEAAVMPVVTEPLPAPVRKAASHACRMGVSVVSAPVPFAAATACSRCVS
ncbi:hypothetical protein [Corallococcus exiguus]|uniref:hypothetical protein n=1 Tax=Corallococcus exiguus TaxID=83462 RepID=UPI0014942F1C|nr:hypothetical protein [Corallococcus exiguus]NPD22161.1 hypothetical protein [Corallococcus exiguus]